MMTLKNTQQRGDLCFKSFNGKPGRRLVRTSASIDGKSWQRCKNCQNRVITSDDECPNKQTMMSDSSDSVCSTDPNGNCKVLLYMIILYFSQGALYPIVSRDTDTDPDSLRALCYFSTHN